MSSQKGNASRTRSQKYQNTFTFKNNLHDKTPKTKYINSINVGNVCERCKKIIEWKIKYKKYKPLKAPTKCTRCLQKVVKEAYHIKCTSCAKEDNTCPKCGEKAELVSPKLTEKDQFKLDAEMQAMLKSLPERSRRTFIRFVNRRGNSKHKETEDEDKDNSANKKSLSDRSSEEHRNYDAEDTALHEELLLKLKSMACDEKDCDSSNPEVRTSAGGRKNVENPFE
ncbi:uncharacterized protein C9orf85 homolog [Orussus abietinus]|uniref:uncharacterized protein C9orf85 homolog n=1 Tax=Orussus abietinus TaxID=222816 RepID=UPI00062535CC|nr:uncharacterized protein C9orf85 homolog [Orussus abietinus]